MADERDELTPAQRALNAALALNEAVYEIMSLAQTPAQLDTLLAAATPDDPDDEPVFSAALDKIAEALAWLHHAGREPLACSRLADAAERWTRGED